MDFCPFLPSNFIYEVVGFFIGSIGSIPVYDYLDKEPLL